MNRQPIKFEFKPLTMKQKAQINRVILRNIASDLCGVDRQILCEFNSNSMIKATKK